MDMRPIEPEKRPAPAADGKTRVRTAQAPKAKPAAPQGGSGRQMVIDRDYERSVDFANRGCLLAFAAVIVAALVVLLIGFFFVKAELDGNNAKAAGTVSFEVPAGSGGQSISRLLEEEELIGNSAIFRLYVRLNGVSGFKSGQYPIVAGSSYDEIIDQLTQPPPPRDTITVNFPEGSTVIQFANICEREGLCTAQEFIDAANNGDYSDIAFWQHIDTQPYTYMKAEGYLFPATYEFYVDETASSIVRKLFERFNKEITSDVYLRMEELNINLRQLVTMASIIEEEASVSVEEMAPVSGVFWNRLNTDHPQGDFGRRTLGTDVTTRYLSDFVMRNYGAPDYTGYTLEQMKAAMLQVMPPEQFYAYYTGDEDASSIEGLPVGPVSSPGSAALTAALYPQRHDLYYFVTDAYNEFRYAKTYNQHLANVQAAYQANAKKAEEDAAAAQASAAEGG